MLNALWYALCSGALSLVPTSIFIQFASLVQYTRLGFIWYKLKLDSPTTFNEKINYLKLKQLHPEATVVADKVKVRSWVASYIGSDVLIPLIGIYNSTSDIPFLELPHQFVLKVNHGSGWNIICTDKSRFNIDKAKKRLSKWMGRNAFYLSREKQYKDITPQILIEELIGENVLDYKFFCTKGEPFAIQVDMNRFSKHQRALYDIEWRRMEIGINYPIPQEPIDKPLHLDRMMDIARKLSQEFLFCRVDLYEVEGKIYFGEITLCPGGGFEPFHSYEQDLQFGQFVQVDD